MFQLYRVFAAALLGLSALFVASPALASFPPVASVKYVPIGYTGNEYPISSATDTREAACQLTLSAYVYYVGAGRASSSMNGDICVITVSNPGQQPYSITYKPREINAPASCPANSTSSSGACSCNAGFVQNAANNGCVPYVSPDDAACRDAEIVDNSTLGMGSQYGTVSGRISSGDSVCMKTAGVSPGKGCAGVFEADIGFKDGDKWKTTGYSRRNSGDKQSCTVRVDGDPVDPEKPPLSEPAKCPPGQAPGKVNGLDICAKIGAEVPKETTTKKEETTVKPDGSTVGEVTTEKTECDGKNCTTTKTKVTTKTPVGGGDPVVETETNTSVCRVGQGSCGVIAGGTGSGGAGGEGSSFTGACASGFKCAGDAIQCAMAREQHQQNCKLYTPDTEPASAFNQAVAGTDGFSMDSLKANAQSVTVQQFDTAGRGWAKSCPADPQIPLGFGGSNASFVIPFSRICGPLEILALAGVGITLLGSMLWVLGGKKS